MIYPSNFAQITWTQNLKSKMTMLDRNNLKEEASIAVGIDHGANMKEGKLVTSLKPQDVLMGRGNGPNDHIGNGAFRYTILDRLDEYVSTISRKKKDKIARKVVRIVQAKNGRFVRKLSKGEKRSRRIPAEKGGFVVVKDSMAILKTKQAFRYVNKAMKRFARNKAAGGSDDDTSVFTDEEESVKDRRSQGGDATEAKQENCMPVTPEDATKNSRIRNPDFVSTVLQDAKEAMVDRRQSLNTPYREELQAPLDSGRTNEDKQKDATNIEMLCDVAMALDTLGNSVSISKPTRNDGLKKDVYHQDCCSSLPKAKVLSTVEVVGIGTKDSPLEIYYHNDATAVSVVSEQ